MQRSDARPVAPPDSFRELPDDQMPPWFREVADRFLSRQSNQFLLTGNVADLVDGLGVAVPTDAASAGERYVPLARYISDRLRRRGRFVLTYNIARGISFPGGGVAGSGNEDFNRLREFYAKYDAFGLVMEQRDRDKRVQKFDRAIVESQVYSFLTLRFLEELCRLARAHRGGEPIAGGLTILVQHAEMLLPDAPLAQMADIDRQKLTLLREWFTDPAFVESQEQILLISPTMAAVHTALRQLPHLTITEVPLPSVQARRAFIEYRLVSGQEMQLSRSAEDLASMTAGMTLLTLQNVFLQARYRDGRLDEADILEQLNRLLVSELGEHIEIVKPSHTMADVVGATALKAELARLKALLDTRDPNVAPVGILVAGPNGVGKTFILEAWAAECDRLVIVLKNLRSMWFGQTDAIFEKLRSVLEALGNVILFIDEADTVFGKPGGEGVHETEARLFGNLIRMMGNPRNRGKIVWLLLTARPDNLAPDLKRSGRAGLHMPVFDPEGPDRQAYIDHILGRAGFDPSALTPEQRSDLEARTAELSPADFNEVLVELRAERALTGRLEYEQVVRVLGNILPGQIAAQRRIQTLQALLECSRRSLIPPSLRELGREEVERELEGLQH